MGFFYTKKMFVYNTRTLKDFVKFYFKEISSQF